MGTRSKIATLPAAVRAELDRLIVERAFSGYQALAEWLQALGYQIADDSVQRYGAGLRRQLEALDLARHQALAIAAAGHGAGDTAEALTAVSVQLIQQQVLSILLQSAQLESSERAGTGEADSTIAADCEEAGKAPSESLASALNDTAPKTLDVRDLVRLTRITVDLNRLTQAGHQRAEQLSSERRREAASQSPAQPQANTLSEEAYQAIRNALCDEHALASPSAAAPMPELEGAAAASIQPASDITAPAEAYQSASEASQPYLTADSRTYPHQRLAHIPADAVTNSVRSPLVLETEPPPQEIELDRVG
jgi:hypothetical protein